MGALPPVREPAPRMPARHFTGRFPRVPGTPHGRRSASVGHACHHPLIVRPGAAWRPRRAADRWSTHMSSTSDSHEGVLHVLPVPKKVRHGGGRRAGRGRRRHAGGPGRGEARPGDDGRPVHPAVPRPVRQDQGHRQRVLQPAGRALPLGRDPDGGGTRPRARDDVRGVQLLDLAGGHLRPGDRGLDAVQQRVGDGREDHHPLAHRPAEQRLVQPGESGHLRARVARPVQLSRARSTPRSRWARTRSPTS